MALVTVMHRGRNKVTFKRVPIYLDKDGFWGKPPKVWDSSRNGKLTEIDAIRCKKSDPRARWFGKIDVVSISLGPDQDDRKTHRVPQENGTIVEELIQPQPSMKMEPHMWTALNDAYGSEVKWMMERGKLEVHGEPRAAA